MSLIVDDVTDTFKKEVLVQFAQPNGTVKQGSFMAEFKRVPQQEIDDAPDDTPNSEWIQRVLVSVTGIGKSPSEQLTPEAQLEFVHRTPECVNAAAHVFFRATRPERYDEKTSKTRRSRG